MYNNLSWWDSRSCICLRIVWIVMKFITERCSQKGRFLGEGYIGNGHSVTGGGLKNQEISKLPLWTASSTY